MNINSFMSILLFALSCVGFPVKALSQQNSLVLNSSSASPVAPGGFLDLTVTPPNGFNLTQVAFISDRQLGIVAVVTAPPFHVTAQVPTSIEAGKYEVSAIGIGSPGEVIDSNTLTFDIERSDAPAQLLLQPDKVLFARSATAAPVLVTAVFADGTTLDVSHSTAISYQVDDAAIASVDSTGLISAVHAGDTKLTVAYRKSNGTLISTAPISVFTQIKVPGLDNIPPSSLVNLLPSPNANGWNNTNVTATISATDNPGGSGVQQITFSSTGGQAIPSTNVSGSLASTTISNEGITNLNFFASDLAGNVEPAHTLPIRIDKTPPSINGSRTPAANANNWSNTDVTVSFACADALSGLAAGSPPAATVLSSEGTNQQVSGMCLDLAGNSASATVSGINIDKTPPALSGLPGAGCTLWPPDHKFVTVATISGADALSGLASFNVTGTSSEPMNPNDPDIIISGTGTGPRTVQLRADRLGTGTGRVYTLTTTATDVAGNTTTAVSTCTVPHDQGR